MSSRGMAWPEPYRYESEMQSVRSAVPETRSKRRLTVLCIENDLESVSLIESTVRCCVRCELLVATDGVRGTQLAREHRPDLVVTDLDVDGIGGEEVLARLQADPSTRSLPVIVSGQAPPGVSSRLIGRGAQCYLPKPIDVVELTRAIEYGVEIAQAA